MLQIVAVIYCTINIEVRHWTFQTVWPDVEMQSTPRFYKNSQKTGHNSFPLKWFLKIAQKWPYIWATFVV